MGEEGRDRCQERRVQARRQTRSPADDFEGIDSRVDAMNGLFTGAAIGKVLVQGQRTHSCEYGHVIVGTFRHEARGSG